MSALASAAEAGVPLAQEVEASAPQLASAIDAAPGFLEDAGFAIDESTPTLELTRRLLKAGEPTIKADPTRVVTGAFDLAPAVSNLLTGVLGDENTIKGLFGDDGKGTAAGTLDRFGLGAVSNEPGNQPGYPASNVNRNMFRISAVFNCTMFGVPIEPDCLLDLIGPRRSRQALNGGTDTGSAGDAGGGRGDQGQDSDAQPTPPVGGLDPNGPLGLDGILDGAGRGDEGRDGRDNSNQAAQDLLDFLFKP